MATNQTLKNSIQKKQNSAPGQQQGTTMKGLLSSPAVMNRFEEVLGKRASQFTASILSLYNSENTLQKADPMSVISSAMVAATLDLPVDKNLGYAYGSFRIKAVRNFSLVTKDTFSLLCGRANINLSIAYRFMKENCKSGIR